MIEDKFVDLYARNSRLRDKLIAERGGRKIMVDNRFPRLEARGGRTLIAEVRRLLENLLGDLAASATIALTRDQT